MSADIKTALIHNQRGYLRTRSALSGVVAILEKKNLDDTDRELLLYLRDAATSINTWHNQIERDLVER